MQLQQHALSAAYPSMPQDELKALAQDIKKNGLRQPILLYNGQVLDGWHRYQACLIVGVNPRTIDYKGTDPRAQVESGNEHRRHMTASQRASAKVAVNAWMPEGRLATPSKDGVKPDTGQKCPVKSTEQMAAEAHVGTTTIKQAKEVHKNGSDQLKKAVIEGEIAISKAAEIAKLPKEKQAKAIVAPAHKKEKAPKLDGIDWKAKHDALLEDYNELKENRDDLAGELKTCEAIRSGTLALEMKQLREHLKMCVRRRDELMANAVEMRKQLAWWQKEAKKLGWKPK